MICNFKTPLEFWYSKEVIERSDFNYFQYFLALDKYFLSIPIHDLIEIDIPAYYYNFFDDQKQVELLFKSQIVRFELLPSELRGFDSEEKEENS